jgi:hypothetical protein
MSDPFAGLWAVDRGLGSQMREERRPSFLKKKKQKTFGCLGFGLSRIGSAQFAKVFCFFFSKKKTFLTLLH